MTKTVWYWHTHTHKKNTAISEHTRQIVSWVFALALPSARETLLQIFTGLAPFPFELIQNSLHPKRPQQNGTSTLMVLLTCSLSTVLIITYNQLASYRPLSLSGIWHMRSEKVSVGGHLCAAWNVLSYMDAERRKMKESERGWEEGE